MKKIFKYSINLYNGNDVKVIVAPEYFYPLHVGLQNGKACLWALVDVSNISQQIGHFIRVAGTGHNLPDYFSREHYIGTVQLSGGDLVFHFFWMSRDSDICYSEGYTKKICRS